MNHSLLSLTPNLLLRLESFALFAGALAVYGRISGDWAIFALLLLTPDVTMIGYLRDVRLGSLLYNLGHSLALSGGLIAVGAAAGSLVGVQIGLIWTAHITMDRIVGYGLKYATDFKDTHMQRV